MASVTDGRYRDQPSTSMAASQASMLDDYDGPLSLISTSVYATQKTAITNESQRSLANEILGPNHHLVFPTPEGSVVDDQNLARLSSVSGLSEYPVRSPTDVDAKPLPSPPSERNRRLPSLSTEFEKSIEKNISSPVPVHDSLGFVFKRPEPAPPPMKGVTSPRQSMFIENLEAIRDGDGRSAASGEVSKNATSTDWPLRTPTASPGPRNGLNKMENLTDAGSSNVGIGEPQHAVTVLSPQAKKSNKLNLLPRFLRAKGSEGNDFHHIQGNRLPDDGEAKAAGDNSSQVEAISPKSFFDDESSDGGEDSQIENARQAIIASPVMIKNGSATKVGLKEMLRSSSPVSEGDAASSRTTTIKLLGSDTGSHNYGRETEQSFYAHQDAGTSKDGSVNKGLWKEINPFAPGSAHRSGRPSTGLTAVPTPSPAPKSLRKVSFPSPPPLDIQPGHRFLRQSIVSTPYPPGDNDRVQKRAVQTPSTVFSNEAQIEDGIESILTLVVYGNGTSSPKVKNIKVPNLHRVSMVEDIKEKKLPIEATQVNDFDDEKLFKLIRNEYTSMRGTLRHLVSARTVRSIKLLSFQLDSQLYTKTAKPVHFHTDEGNGTTPETRMQTLLTHPKAGRGHHEWTQWIHSQPGNTKEPFLPNTEKLAFELVESWSPTKLYLAIAAVLISSVATTLLWVFLGTGRGNVALDSAFGAVAQLSEAETGYRGAAKRVQGGAMLGLLVLFLGWTGVAGWLVLSWSVM